MYFSVWYFINGFGTFLFVLLSLFLSVSCSMAPKRKSTPSWNPLHSGASSSSPSVDYTPSHVWFHDDKAYKDFLEKFLWHGIHSKHQVILSDFSDIDLPIIISSRGWESLCGIQVTCPSVIIQDFYSNMHGFNYFIPHPSHSHSRYTHCSYFESYIQGATHTEGRVWWLPRMWAS